MNKQLQASWGAGAPTPCRSRLLGTQSRDVQFKNRLLCLCFILFLRQLKDLQNHDSFASCLFLGEVVHINHWQTMCKDFLPCLRLLTQG